MNEQMSFRFVGSQLADRAHSTLIERHFGNQLTGHDSQDSTTISVEKSQKNQKQKRK